MNNLLVVFTFAVVALAAAYDFNDEVYNQLIKQDLDDLESSLLSNSASEGLVNVRRRKREDEAASTTAAPGGADKCRKRRWRMCCGEDILEHVVEKDRELKKECFKEVMANTKEDKSTGMYDPFSCEKVNKIKKEWACVIECVGQKKNIVDEAGNFKEKELFEHYKKELGSEQWFYDLIVAAFPKCMEQVKNDTAFVKDKEDPLSCNPLGIKMHHCMFRELQLTCPEDKITDMKTCSKIREKIKKHDFLPFRHHHHDDD